MKNSFFKLTVLFSLFLVASAEVGFAQSVARVELQKIRWIFPETHPIEIAEIITELNNLNKVHFSESDFKLSEDTRLSGMSFKFYQQYVDELPVKDAGIRLWVNSETRQFIQMVSFLQNPQSKNLLKARQQINFLNKPMIRESKWSRAAVLSVSAKDIKKVINFSQSVAWDNERLISELVVFGRDRKAIYKFDALTMLFIDKKIQHYPQAETPKDDEWFVFGKAFTVNEEYETEYVRQFSGEVPETVEIKYLKNRYIGTDQDWTNELPQKRFLDSLYDEEKAKTPEGIAAGYWSNKSLQNMIDSITQIFPENANNVTAGARFVGRYVSVHVNPEALNVFQVENFPVKYSNEVARSWSRETIDGITQWVMHLAPSIFGTTFHSSDDLFERRAENEVAPNTKRLIEDGFDEMQVYWSVNTWFETLHQAGFNDSELSTRPISANLFDPDIEMRDNAFYNDDTINFTTYTERNQNEARSLTTVWHELGHGLMDRLQGSSGFSNGGLSEGIADFAAELVLRGFNRGTLHPVYSNRRINNSTAFGLTNESHDDGEAYGGALKDILEKRKQTEGHMGYRKVSDMVLDAMRLTRRFPNMTLNEWYESLMLSDSLGRVGIREKNELATDIAEAFAARNFIYNQPAQTKLNIYHNDLLVDESSKGSRYSPYLLDFTGNESGQMALTVQLKLEQMDGQYQFPMKVKVSFKETNSQQGSALFLDESPKYFEINKVGDVVDIPVTVLRGCQFANQGDGSCKDFANIYVYSNGNEKPFAKKRFYIQSAPQ